MRKPVLVGLAAACAAALFAGGVSYASDSKSSDQDRQHSAARPNLAPHAAVDSTTELKFTAIAPCRVVDTRGHGNAFSNGTRTFKVSGETSLASQGGSPTGCGVPAGAVTAAATITAVATGSGFLKAWATGSSTPATSFMNYAKTINASTGGNIPLSPAGFINIQPSGSPTNVIVDITGYYVKPLYANVNFDGTLSKGSRTTGVTHVGTGFYEVDFDRNVSLCSYVATAVNTGVTIEVQPRSGNVDGVFIGIRNLSNNLVDQDFDLIVAC